MRALVACEFSGIVRDAFSANGHDAWSCDLLPTERPGQHIRGDCRDYLDRDWDLIIGHPPCTYLTKAAAWRWPTTQQEIADAFALVMAIYNAPASSVAVENPPGLLSRLWRKADQYIQPWQFGHGETKQTGLWLRNLPQLTPTEIVPGRVHRLGRLGSYPNRWKARSRTYPGIAAAMAEQWG